jgi:hypothetical protein
MKKLLFTITIITGIVFLALSTCSAEEDFLEGKRQADFAFLGGEAGEMKTDIPKEIEKDYSRELTFLNRMGKYLSDIPLKIYGRKDNLFLTSVSDRPWFIFDIPFDTYRLQASFQLDQKKISPIDIGNRKEKFFSGQLSIRW